MRVNGRRIFLDNHAMEDLDKMYLWCTDKEIVELEMGQPDAFKDIDDFKNRAMAKYLSCTHEANEEYCDFGVYRADNGELVGSANFFDIGESGAELSVMIADKKYRHKHYGMDAFFAALEYGFKTRNWQVIKLATRMDNGNVKGIFAKLGLEYKTERYSDENYDVDLIMCQIDKGDYDRIASRSRGFYGRG